MSTVCSACRLKALAENKYCLHHKEAYNSLNSHYKAWVKAYGGGISWEEFLSKLSDMQETGRWIKEVIAVELKKK
jgi:hypothetical protein